MRLVASPTRRQTARAFHDYHTWNPGKPARGVIEVAAAHAIPAEMRLYDQLFARPDPESDGRDLLEGLNPQSETVLTGALLEPSLAEVQDRK